MITFIVTIFFIEVPPHLQHVFIMNNNNNNEEHTKLPEVSKEHCVASIYRSELYHPFIHQIRVKCYDMDPDGPIPDNLRAVGWMDGAISTLKHLTEEENMQIEDDLKISISKQSATRQ